MSSLVTNNPHVGKKSTVGAHKLQSIERCIKALEHAAYCDDKQCNTIGCVKIKRVLSHKLNCIRKVDGCCICRQFIALCCYHAKRCSNSQCIVSYCSDIKTRILRGGGSGKDQFLQRCAPSHLTVPKNDNQQSNKNYVERTNSSVPLCVPNNETEEATRKKSIEFCVMSLEHACYCDFKECQFQSCIKQKKVVRHVRNCESNQSCSVCQQYNVLCSYHAKCCTRLQCLVPSCKTIKATLPQVGTPQTKPSSLYLPD